MKKIRVLHLELDEHLGGIESFLYNLYNEIDRNKIQFDFVTRTKKPAYKDELEKLGAVIYKVSSYRNPLKYLKDLDRLIKKGEYNIVHIHKNSAAIIFPFLITRKNKRIKVFVHSHNTRPSVVGISLLLHFINKRFLYYSADEHFACSKLAGDWLYGTQKNYTVLKNGILVEKYRFDNTKRYLKRKELGISEDIFVLGNVGRFTEQKNQKRLVELFGEFQEINPNSLLLLIGDGELRDDVEKYAKRLKISNILFLGIREDIPELMMAMDIYIMPSLYEGLPLVGVEAQATGLSMLVSDTVSDELEITDNFDWFSLEDNNSEIIKKIVCRKKCERRKYADVVSDSGFNMQDTAEYLFKQYKNYSKQ